MIWNETIECMNREEMRKLQSIRLRRVVNMLIIILLSIVKKCRKWGLPRKTSILLMI